MLSGMKIIIDLAVAAARGESIRSILTTARMTNENATYFGGTNAPATRLDAEGEADADLLELADENLGTPSEALSGHLSQLRRSLKTEEAVVDALVEITVGARKVRDWMDDLEVTAGRVARAHGASARRLAEATGIAERNAAKRYRLVPGERWTSIR